MAECADCPGNASGMCCNPLVCSWCGRSEKDCDAAQSGFKIDLVPRDEYEVGRPACLK